MPKTHDIGPAEYRHTFADPMDRMVLADILVNECLLFTPIDLDEDAPIDPDRAVEIAVRHKIGQRILAKYGVLRADQLFELVDAVARVPQMEEQSDKQ
jgi:hypothetical protein